MRRCAKEKRAMVVNWCMMECKCVSRESMGLISSAIDAGH